LSLADACDSSAAVTRLPFSLLPFLLLPAVALAGVIEGRVTIPSGSVAPAAKPRYPLAATYEVGEPDPPAAIVYLEGGPDDPAIETDDAVDVAQERYQFAPGLLAVRAGTVVRFPNRDDEYHSVFSYSKPKRFDLGRYHKEETPAAVVFDRPGVVKLYCEIHDHMRGTIVVVAGGLFAKTDADGRYRIEDVPAGTYGIKAWLDDEIREASVVVPAAGAVTVDFPE
jgi:plastocyanin